MFSSHVTVGACVQRIPAGVEEQKNYNAHAMSTLFDMSQSALASVHPTQF
jgi:hypothetical protein